MSKVLSNLNCNGHWTAVADPCEDRDGYNVYILKEGDLVGSIDCLMNEGAYENHRGVIKNVPREPLKWMNMVFNKFDWETGEYGEH